MGAVLFVVGLMAYVALEGSDSGATLNDSSGTSAGQAIAALIAVTGVVGFLGGLAGAGVSLVRGPRR